MSEATPTCQGRTNSFPPTCERQSTVERNGKRYCWQHDPGRTAQKSEEQAHKVLLAAHVYGLTVKSSKVTAAFLLYRGEVAVGHIAYRPDKKKEKWSASSVEFIDSTKEFQSAEAAVRYVAGVAKTLKFTVSVDLSTEGTFGVDDSKKLANVVSKAVATEVWRFTGEPAKAHCWLRGQLGES